MSISNVEIVSHSVPQKPPRPLRFRFTEKEIVKTGKVLRVLDMKLNRWNGNIMYEYHCECLIDGFPGFLKISYEKDTMNWYIMK